MAPAAPGIVRMDVAVGTARKKTVQAEKSRTYHAVLPASAAVMLRSQGVPARVASGFAMGTYNADIKAYQVATGDAHAWVEVYFPGYGWVAFDPTPGNQANGQRPAEFERGDRRTEIVLHHRLRFVGKRGAQDQDGQRDVRAPELDPLIDRGDPQEVHAVLLGRDRDLDGAMPVRVRLDDEEDASRGTEDRAEGTDIGVEGVEADFGPCGVTHTGAS